MNKKEENPAVQPETQNVSAPVEETEPMQERVRDGAQITPSIEVSGRAGKKRMIIDIIALIVCALIAAGVLYLHFFLKPASYELLSAKEVATEETMLIAHRGYRAVAPENTAPAFEKAGEAGFDGAECDIYRTKDGVWIIQHDFNALWMTGSLRKIESSTYESLRKKTVNNGVNIEDYPDLQICTLEEYLAICKKYEMVPVIELKSKNNTEYYKEVVDLVEKSGVDKVIYISFYENCLQAMRKLTDADLYYLCGEVTEEAISVAKGIENCGLDFNGNTEENFENDAAAIKKAQEAGLSLGAWTIDDLDTMQKLLDLGIQMITTDNITYS